MLSGKEKAIYCIFVEMEVQAMFFLFNITLSFCWLAFFFCPLCYSWFFHLYLKNLSASGDLLSKELDPVSRFRQLAAASSPWKSFLSSIIQDGCRTSHASRRAGAFMS